MATIIQFAFLLIMLIGGILLLGLAFNTPVMPGLVFVAGIHFLTGVHHPDDGGSPRYERTEALI